MPAMLDAAPSADWLGSAAAVLTTGSFLPQAVLTLRTRNVSGISLGMYLMFTLGVAFWLAYGLAIGQWPVIVANAVTLVLASLILLTKWQVERGTRRERSPGDATAADRRGD
jgi:MtN3 and saliva related transmembrane protein